MRTYLFISKTNNDVIAIVAKTSNHAALRLETDLAYLKEGATDYIFASSVKCELGQYCIAVIV